MASTPRDGGFFVPDHPHVLSQDVLEDMLAIVITIRAGKNDDADIHVMPTRNDILR